MSGENCFVDYLTKTDELVGYSFHLIFLPRTRIVATLLL